MSTGAATWEGKGVSLGQIDTQLQRLWRAADSDWNGEGRRPDIRTSVLNLIVYARNEDCRQRATEAIEHLSGTHPSRSVIIVPGASHGEGSIDASLSIMSHGSYAEFRQVCSEQIVLWVHGPASQHLSSVVIPLLAPDLPVFVWWPGETPFQHHIYHQLRELADHFVVDSSDFAQPGQDLVQMGHAVRGSADAVAFSDFNWARLAPWRDAVAEFFDMPQFLPYLDRLRSVHMGCVPHLDSHRYDLPQALLLTGWLTSCLGLQPTERHVSDNHYALHAADGLRQVDIHINVAESPEPVVLRLQCQASPAQPEAEFTVAMEATTGQVTATAQIASQDAQVRKSLIAQRDEAYLLFQELEVFDHNEPYERALLATASLLDPRYQPAQVRGSLLV